LSACSGPENTTKAEWPGEKARRIYFGVQLVRVDPSDPDNSTKLKVQPVVGKYLDLQAGAKTYPTIDLGVVNIEYDFD
jgi:hypothetical protein